MTVMWALNGFAQAMMWPPIVKILVSTANETEYAYAVVRVSWGSSFGTVLMYLTAPLIIGLVGWQGVFVASAVIGASATVIWGILSRRIPVEKPSAIPTDGEKKPKMYFPRRAVLPIILIVFGIIFQGMLRDGVTNWMPTYLAEVFDFGNKTSIFITVSLAVFSILTFGVADKLYRKFFQNEVMCGGVIFATAVLSAVVMALFFNAGAWLAVLMMAMITGCMHGVNLMLITHVPKRFKKYGNISTISGALNSCTYVGAAIATYGVAKLSEIVGWRNTVGVWAIIGLLGTACCFVAVRMWKNFIEE
jgi:OPA family glycerol-3-phosphate transporter-like MFS transporter